MNLNAFIEWASGIESDFNFSDERNAPILNEAFFKSKMYLGGASDKISEFLGADAFEYVFMNLMLHYVICDSRAIELYCKYNIENKDFMIESQSAGSSSASIKSFSSLDNGEFMLNDLVRTPYGRLVYSNLESLKGAVIALL